MGGAVAILTAAREEVSALATMAAVGRADLLPERAVGKKGLKEWARKGYIQVQGEKVGYALVEDSLRTNVAAAAGRVSCPWLMLHGEKDEVIPTTDADLLLRASSGRATLEIVAGADHRFSDESHRARLTCRITSFLQQALSES
jgi:pimeloyl-ACP methyl ester carboxylesterase